MMGISLASWGQAGVRSIAQLSADALHEFDWATLTLRQGSGERASSPAGSGCPQGTRWADPPTRPEVSDFPHPDDELLARTALQNGSCHLVEVPRVRDPREQT